MDKVEREIKPSLIRKKELRKLPPELINIENWQTNRRTVLKGALLAGALSQLSFLQACKANLENGNELLTGEQVTILQSILLQLFPDDGNGPSVLDLHTFEYIMWILQDPGADQDTNSFIIEGIDWANETAQEIYLTNYVELDDNQKTVLLEKFTQLEYGKDWCSVLVTLIFESLLLDPIYGGNPDGIGWKWLNHNQGFPQPTEALRYEKVTETARAAY